MQQNSYTPAPAQKRQVTQTTKFITQKNIDGTFRLMCPVCGKLSLESIPWDEVHEMVWAGYSSICVNCDPDPDLDAVTYSPAQPCLIQPVTVMQDAA